MPTVIAGCGQQPDRLIVPASGSLSEQRAADRIASIDAGGNCAASGHIPAFRGQALL